MQITTPRMPPSRTSRLLPKPTHRSGVSAGSSARNAARSARSRGVKNRSAAPPTCQEVWLDIGSARRTRAANSLDTARFMAAAPPHAGRRAWSAVRGRWRRCCPRPWSTTTSPSRSTSRSAAADVLDALHEHRLDLAAAAHRAADRAAVRALDGRFAGRVHLGDQQHVGPVSTRRSHPAGRGCACSGAAGTPAPGAVPGQAWRNASSVAAISVG